MQNEVENHTVTHLTDKQIKTKCFCVWYIHCGIILFSGSPIFRFPRVNWTRNSNVYTYIYIQF